MGGSFVVKGDPIYSEGEISKKVTEENYIPISTPEELDNLRKGEKQTFGRGTKWEKEYTSGLDKKYIQVADIDLGGIENFEPIGSGIYARFTGEFDGGEYVINNLSIDRGSVNYVGLFGYMDGATLENIGLEDIDVKGGRWTGGLAGHSGSSNISKSYVTGQVWGRDRVGGLVGSSGSSNIGKSYFAGEVTGTERYIGGLAGTQGGSSNISQSYATGQVTGGNSVGGLVGYNTESTDISISNSYTTVQVTGEYTVGALVGLNDSSVKDSGWADDVNPELSWVSLNRGTLYNVIGRPKTEIDKIIKDLIK